jgi:deazaflavin-dependent oxidoreductase (nitroreductase family)
MEKLMKVINQFPMLLLRSPLHGVLSKNVLLLTVKGRKSGTLYTTPVNYLRHADEILITTDSSWWKNLRGGAQVTMRIEGKDVRGAAEAVTEEGAVGETLLAMLKRFPGYGKRVGVTLTPEGHADSRQMQQAIKKGRVLVRVHLEE